MNKLPTKRLIFLAGATVWTIFALADPHIRKHGLVRHSVDFRGGDVDWIFYVSTTACIVSSNFSNAATMKHLQTIVFSYHFFVASAAAMKHISGMKYEIEITDDNKVTISCDGVWACDGQLNEACLERGEAHIDNADAPLGDDVYEALDEALTDAMERGETSAAIEKNEDGDIEVVA